MMKSLFSLHLTCVENQGIHRRLLLLVHRPPLLKANLDRMSFWKYFEATLLWGWNIPISPLIPPLARMLVSSSSRVRVVHAKVKKFSSTSSCLYSIKIFPELTSMMQMVLPPQVATLDVVLLFSLGSGSKTTWNKLWSKLGKPKCKNGISDG